MQWYDAFPSIPSVNSFIFSLQGFAKYFDFATQENFN